MQKKKKDPVPDPVKEFIEQIEKKNAEMNRNLSAFMQKVKESIKKIDDTIFSWDKRIIDHNKFLENLFDSNSNLEELVLNVLLAIRQNEYLQAWYPKQSGYPEMKICGTHPLKTKEKEDASKNPGQDQEF